MPRLARNVLPAEGIYHVTARGVARTAIVRDDDDARLFLALLARETRGERWDCHAFCLMPNHYHLVIETARENMSNGFQRLNGIHAQGFNAKHKRWGHLFGERFWCVALEEDDLERTCLYVMDNPVRAGLCERSSDWPWSACRYDLD